MNSIKIEEMLLALIIRGRKLIYFFKNDPFALIRGRTNLEKWRFLTSDIYIFNFKSCECTFGWCYILLTKKHWCT